MKESLENRAHSLMVEVGMLAMRHASGREEGGGSQGLRKWPIMVLLPPERQV